MFSTAPTVWSQPSFVVLLQIDIYYAPKHWYDDVLKNVVAEKNNTADIMLI